MQELSPAFTQQITELMGQDEAKALFEALDGEAPCSIRFNQTKQQSTLDNHLNLRNPVPWCPTAFYLKERPLFTADPLFHAGAYYVQEASSMLLYQVKELLGEEAMTALDLCAAPGGKSTLLQDILPKDSLLISNEVVPNRANVLLENMLKAGKPMSIVCSSMPDKWSKIKQAFDLILVDAPCSGEGMFRKDLNARTEWQVDSPLICANRQKDILTNIYGCLKDNGLLIYSTCTFNRLENEGIVDFIMESFDVEAIELSNLPEEVLRSPYTTYPCYRMQPNRLEGEGLFMAVFRKKDGGAVFKSSEKSKLKKESKHKQAANIPQAVRTFIQSAEDYHFETQGDATIYAYKPLVHDYLNLLQSYKIAVLSAGIPLAQVKGKSLIPHPALALSTEINLNNFEKVELNLEEAILYLGRQNISLSENLSKGFKLLSYQGQNIGFVKHLGNRTNNLYPNEWRIRQWETILSKLRS